ncbi:type II toxin-antitoxin system death-on-curing family toxin [Phragmitibacter flavus]|uniref:Type II toxin-antitoxin system death-on-curing family toxin n=1 Tax=Phragmitibacter flavus TaxID=2576071 RepID=A0A5R8KAK2_9BACT|nr:type II toxin-antitoxin system death-on-curing family toxin [Phragmitibacter flavus]TLD69334.1 type II toxin-antitoxin system death-on-curing family toxin [Phragmitibacter flavus]
MSAEFTGCLHLSVEMVSEIHEVAIARFGGSQGLRDRALLESAVAAPQAEFGGQSPYTDLIDMAAAYLFFLCSNHPFVDGNKRAALGACLVFLKLNGFRPKPDSVDWENLTLAVAAGALSREEVTVKLRELVLD